MLSPFFQTVTGWTDRGEQVALGKPAAQPSREGTVAITVHFPEEVRAQLKSLAAKKRTKMKTLLAEAFNDLFARYGKPEIAPKEYRDRRGIPLEALLRA